MLMAVVWKRVWVVIWAEQWSWSTSMSSHSKTILAVAARADREADWQVAQQSSPGDGISGMKSDWRPIQKIFGYVPGQPATASPEQGPGPDDLQRSVPTSATLWFSEYGCVFWEWLWLFKLQRSVVSELPFVASGLPYHSLWQCIFLTHIFKSLILNNEV